MPEIGEIRGGRQIGYKGKNRYTWRACIICGKEHWVQLRWAKYRNHQPVTLKCRSCLAIERNKNGALSPNWKGGRTESRGYVYIRLQPDDFFYPMATKNGYVGEHRLVVAKALSRCLLPWEIVHHKGVKYPSGSEENRGDNRYPENLQLLKDKKYHLIDSLVKTHINKQAKLIGKLQARVTLLEAELVVVRDGVNNIPGCRIWNDPDMRMTQNK